MFGSIGAVITLNPKGLTSCLRPQTVVKPGWVKSAEWILRLTPGVGLRKIETMAKSLVPFGQSRTFTPLNPSFGS